MLLHRLVSCREVHEPAIVTDIILLYSYRDTDKTVFAPYVSVSINRKVLTLT